MRLSKLFPRLVLCLLVPLAALLAPPSAFAQSIDPAVADAQRLLKQGQAGQALNKINTHLGGKPKDPQGRFVKGLILTEMKRNGEAILIFKKLTEDYPELPEPYNNLAVLYEQEKQYEKARQALEAAIKTHPAYAVAHENLGDIYAKLASQAYGKALQIDARNTHVQSKMAMIRDLAPPASLADAGKPAGRTADDAVRLASAEPVAQNTAPAPAPAIASAPVVAISAVTATPVVVAPVAVAPVAPVAVVAPAKVPPAPAEPAPAAPVAVAAAPAPTKTAPNHQDSPAKAINAWADAWSRKDVKGYLAAYAPDFRPPNGQNRKAWENERSSRITKPGAISVDVEKIVVESNGHDKATVKFRQNYRSANLKSTTGKTMTLVRHNGRWLIQQERVN